MHTVIRRASWLAALALAGCAATVEPEKAPRGEAPAAGSPGAVRVDTGEHDGVAVRADVAPPPRPGYDFGTLPAATYYEPMRFAAAMNQARLLVGNEGVGDVTIAGVAFRDVRTEEPENPFSACGIAFEPVTVPPGWQAEEYVCFNPTLPGVSSARVEWRDASGRVVASVPVRGSARPIVVDEPLPISIVPPPGHIREVGADRRVIVRDGRLIRERSGQDVTPEVFYHRRMSYMFKLGCVVLITGGGEIPNPAVRVSVTGPATNTGNIGIDQGVPRDEINVGQHVILDILVLCPSGQVVLNAVLWTIGGDEIEDYDETLRGGAVTTTPLTMVDRRAHPVDFYWKDTGTHTVQADVTYTWNGVQSSVSVNRDFVVERNATDIDRQMEDFYVWNHEGRILEQHRDWHMANPTNRCTNAGEDFFVFHRQIVGAHGVAGSAGGWRTTFGYGAIGSWDATGALPAAPDVNHAGRNAPFTPMPKPSFYTTAGGTTISKCKRAKKLSDFATAADLSNELEGRWHNRGHGRVGGDMRSPSAPKDPIFYRWHKAIDSVYHEYLNPPP